MDARRRLLLRWETWHRWRLPRWRFALRILYHCQRLTRDLQDPENTSTEETDDIKIPYIIIFKDPIGNDETTRQRKQTLRKAYIRNVYILRRRLLMLSDEKWVRWLQGPRFRPVWLMLWRQWLGFHNHSTEMLEPLRLEVFRLVSGHFKFLASRHCILTPQHRGAVHLARFLTMAVLCNFGPRTLSRVGVDTEPLRLMWAALLVVKLSYAPSYFDLPRGGRALLGTPYEQLRR